MNVLELAALVAVHPEWPVRLASTQLAFVDHAACVYHYVTHRQDGREMVYTAMPRGWVGDGTPCSYCSGAFNGPPLIDVNVQKLGEPRLAVALAVNMKSAPQWALSTMKQLSMCPASYRKE